MCLWYAARGISLLCSLQSPQLQKIILSQAAEYVCPSPKTHLNDAGICLICKVAGNANALSLTCDTLSALNELFV